MSKKKDILDKARVKASKSFKKFKPVTAMPDSLAGTMAPEDFYFAETAGAYRSSKVTGTLTLDEMFADVGPAAMERVRAEARDALRFTPMADPSMPESAESAAPIPWALTTPAYRLTDAPECIPFSAAFPREWEALRIDNPVLVDFDLPDYRSQTLQGVPKAREFLGQERLVYDFAHGYAFDRVMHLVGPAGCGKSEGLPAYFAHALGLPYLRLDCTPEKMFSDFVGERSAKDGSTYYAHGLLPAALEAPGLICFDEFLRLGANAQQAAMPLFERDGKLRIESTKEVIERHPASCIFVSNNMKGLGDEADRIASNPADTALLNRIQRTLEVTYPSIGTQTMLVQLWVPGIPEPLAKQLAKFASMCQKAYQNRQLPLTFSPRNLRTAAEDTASTGGDVAYALRMAYVNMLAEASDIECVHNIYRAVFAKEMT